jgi:hypothetical protein
LATKGLSELKISVQFLFGNRKMTTLPSGMGLKRRLSYDGSKMSNVVVISSLALISELQKATTAAQAFYSEGKLKLLLLSFLKIYS